MSREGALFIFRASDQNSEVEIQLERATQGLRMKFPILHLSGRAYIFGSMKIRLKIFQEQLYVAIGDSTQFDLFDDFYAENYEQELREVERKALQGGISIEQVAELERNRLN